ncbi:MAG: LLM class flavin-dependent oxidoreductase [Armatimonadota bacterium]|nr:LLM class flavin-dependent oxidoreductase [Armatimonadota bacterium]
MRIGFALGYDPTMRVQEMASWMQYADARGYELGFFSETINLVRDSVSALAAFAGATRRLRLAGEIGDGVLLNAVTSPGYAANALRIVRQAAEAAGRDWAQFEVAAIVPTSLEETREAAIEAIRWEVASKFHPRRMAYNARVRTAVGEPVIREDDLPAFRAAFEQGGPEALARALPRAYIEELTACGTADDVARRIAAYRDAGVQLPLLRPAARHQIQRILDTFAPAVSGRPAGG